MNTFPPATERTDMTALNVLFDIADERDAHKPAPPASFTTR